MRRGRTVVALCCAAAIGCGGTDGSSLRGSGPSERCDDVAECGGGAPGGGGFATSFGSGGTGLGGGTGGAPFTGAGGTIPAGGAAGLPAAGGGAPLDGDAGTADGGPVGTGGAGTGGGGGLTSCPAVAPMSGNLCFTFSLQCRYGSTTCACLLLLMLPVWACQ